MGAGNLSFKPFFIVLARNRQFVEEKIVELEGMKMPYLIICGDRVSHPNVVYREARGKWDAINFGAKFVPKETNVVVLNDVDTRIHNLEHAFSHLNINTDLVYCKVRIPYGPQVKFYRLLNPIRKRLHVAASGELMLMKRRVFEQVLPIPPCLAEDSYILFKALEIGYRAKFCEKTYVTTERTSNLREEEVYKTRTTLGIYQALDYSKPPVWIRAFYRTLPFAAPLLGLAGEDGKAWAKGIRRAIGMHKRKEQPTRF